MNRVTAPFVAHRSGWFAGEKSLGSVSAPFGGSNGLVCLAPVMA